MQNKELFYKCKTEKYFIFAGVRVEDLDII